MVKLAPSVNVEIAGVRREALDSRDARALAAEGEVRLVGRDVRAAREGQGRSRSMALQVPGGERAVPETCAIAAERASVPESASMVPVLFSVPLTRIVDVPVPPVFSIVPSLTMAVSRPKGLSTSRSRPRSGRRPPARSRESGGLVVAVQPEDARAGLDDGPLVVDRAVVEKNLLAGPG